MLFVLCGIPAPADGVTHPAPTQEPLPAPRFPWFDDSMSKARVAIFRGVDLGFELEERALPEPGPGEALVEIEWATICGSDLHSIRGRREVPVPSVLGHEAVGRVVAVGEGRNPTWLGRRVTWTLADSCGTCPACTRWRLPQKCGSLFKYGHAPIDSGSGLNGCYASHILLRAGTPWVEVPAGLEPVVAAPVNCALATMVAAVGGLPRPGELAVVQGAGLLGIYSTALLREAGWKRVLVVDRNPQRLARVAAFGGEPVEAGSASRMGGGVADVVIEVAGDPSAVPDAIRWLRPGGPYELVGMVHPDSRMDLTAETLIRKCLTLHGTHNYAPSHLEQAVRFLAAHRESFPWHSLFSPVLPLESLGEAMSLAESGRWCRVVVAPGA